MLYIKSNQTFPTRKELLRYILRTKNVTTYKDKECTVIDVAVGASGNKNEIYRSVTDLHQIVLSNFPKTKFESTVRIISELIDEEKNVAFIWCRHINKVVLKYCQPGETGYLTNYSEKNYFKSKGVDGYSLEDYLVLIKKLKK